MKILLNTILLILFLSSCSEQKKIAKFLKKHSPKDVATFIAREYPEYLRADTIRYRDTIIQEKEIKVPEIVYDTILKIDTINDCKVFHYSDRNLKFDLEKEKVTYKIFSRIIKDTVKTIIDKEIPCPPCPTQVIVDNVEKQHNEESISLNEKLKFYTKGFWLLMVIVIGLSIYTVFKIVKKFYL